MESISAYSDRFVGFKDGPLENETEAKACLPGPNLEVTQRWKKRLPIREVKLVESIYYNEMEDSGYEFQFVLDQRDRLKALLWNTLPLHGEIPRLHWWITGWKNGREATKKIIFIFLFPFSFVLSRTLLVYLYMSGKLSTQ